MTAPKLTDCRCQCVACGEYFGSVRGFDRHRVGEYEVNRRCMNLSEMLQSGWARDERGFLLTPDPRRAGVALHGHISARPATCSPVGLVCSKRG